MIKSAFKKKNKIEKKRRDYSGIIDQKKRGAHMSESPHLSIHNRLEML